MLTKTKKDDLENGIQDEVSLLADTLEEVLNNSGKLTGQQLDDLHSKAKGVLKEARARAGYSSNRLGEYARVTAEQTRDFVVEKPWHSLGISSAVGIVLGVLLARR